jgi:hypothetical protein
MSMRIRQLSVAAGAALLLTACGGGGPMDGKTGQEVAEAAADALEKAGAVHVAGTVAQEGEEGEIDLQLQGADAVGTLTFGGSEIEFLNVGGTAYLKAPPGFWGSFGLPEEVAAQFEGQWVTVPGEAASQFQEFSLDGFVEQLRNPSSDVEKDVTEDELDGEPVVIVEQQDGSTLTVANDEPAYPLEIKNEGDEAGSLIFSRFGEEEEIETPADALDLTEMMGGS